MIATAHPTPSPAAAFAHAPASPSLELLEARQLRDSLKTLLRRELAAMAEFLIALADFDRRRGWELLGHASLFAFLRVELRLSNSASFYRKSAAQLLQQFPEVIEPLGGGQLCLSTIAELSKVLTKENRAEVMPRFFGLSAREAQELVAELQPREAPATRAVVTRAVSWAPVLPLPRGAQPPLTLSPTSAGALSTNPNVAPPSRLLTSEVAFGGDARFFAKRDETEPLTADLRRLHVTVSRQFLKKIDAARDGLSHAIPGATTEQVLEAALDLLLEKQAKGRGQVKSPRKSVAPTPTSIPTSAEPRHRRTGFREAIPAAVRRAVWERDGGRCAWPLDGGGCCGSTHRLQLDHLVPWARDGVPTVDNLRFTCAVHNSLAARQVFGERHMSRYVGAKRAGVGSVVDSAGSGAGEGWAPGGGPRLCADRA
jgi:hypothetical protein